MEKRKQKTISMKRITILALRWLMRKGKADEKEKKIIRECFDYINLHKDEELTFFENV